MELRTSLLYNFAIMKLVTCSKVTCYSFYCYV